MVAETIKKTAFRITRMGQLVAQEASRRLEFEYAAVLRDQIIELRGKETAD